jgi:hypothetical protein
VKRELSGHEKQTQKQEGKRALESRETRGLLLVAQSPLSEALQAPVTTELPTAYEAKPIVPCCHLSRGQHGTFLTQGP